MASGAASLRHRDFQSSGRVLRAQLNVAQEETGAKGGFREISTASCRKRELLFTLRVPLLIAYS
jgi:hypothetical protein